MKALFITLGLLLGLAVSGLSSPAPKPIVTPVPSPSATPTPKPTGSPDEITAIVNNSKCSSYGWGNRGSQPAYVRGVAMVFARSLCLLKNGEPGAKEMAKANTGNDSRDALSWYNSNFKRLSMTNATSGEDTMRHLFVLLMGLGMRESSGKYCTGYDSTGGSGSRTSNGAESGIFQASYNVIYEPIMGSVVTKAIRDRISNPGECFLSTFKTGMRGSCDSHSIQGSGSGAAFQALEKHCPGFATEIAAIALRSRRTHFGPLNRKEAELNQACDGMLAQVQLLVHNRNLCNQL